MALKVWFITGASKGFGMELTKAALDAGDIVVATARNPKSIEDAFGKQDRLLTLKLDVTNEQQAKEAVDAALERFGQIDVLINNAGRGLVGAVEEVTADWPGWGIYCATKFMVEGFSEAMQAELEPLGIKVTIVEPGPFRTDFLDDSSLGRTKTVIADYSATAGAAREWADNSHNAQPGDPAKAAAAMVKITEVERPPLRLQLGHDCVAAVEAKLEHVKQELEQWRQLAESTAITG